MSEPTPGPWEWRFCVGGRPELVHPGHGLLLVMDAVRDGMNGAAVRFAERSPADVGGLMYKAAHFFPATPGKRTPDLQLPTNPDMRLIAAAPDMWKALQPIAAAYPDDPGTSDLDNEQPVTITLGDVRRAWAALAKVNR